MGRSVATALDVLAGPGMSYAWAERDGVVFVGETDAVNTVRRVRRVTRA